MAILTKSKWFHQWNVLSVIVTDIKTMTKRYEYCSWPGWLDIANAAFYALLTLKKAPSGLARTDIRIHIYQFCDCHKSTSLSPMTTRPFLCLPKLRWRGTITTKSEPFGDTLYAVPNSPHPLPCGQTPYLPSSRQDSWWYRKVPEIATIHIN